MQFIVILPQIFEVCFKVNILIFNICLFIWLPKVLVVAHGIF